MQLASPLAKKKARIEIIPLIDIIFFLLATFVMVSLSMVKQHGIPVQLPGAAATATALPPEPEATLSIAADGSLFWNKEPAAAVDIRTRLTALAARLPEARVSINGDADARLGAAIELLDAARAAGLTRVSFQTKPASVPHAP